MGRLAYLFAGQGAQVVGMASDVKDLPKVKNLFERAESVCAGVVEKMLCGPQEDLNRTLWTQPAMFLADLAYAYAREEETGAPQAVCGFSVGEVPALCFAGALSEEDALKAIVRRAQLMEEYTGRVQGCMIAVVGLEPEAVEALCDGKNTHPANYNSRKQTVVACAMSEREEFSARVKQAGGRAIPLKVSGMFHCPELAPEAGKIRGIFVRAELSKTENGRVRQSHGAAVRRRFRRHAVRTDVVPPCALPQRWKICAPRVSKNSSRWGPERC